MCDLVLSDTQAHADYYVNELHATREKIRVLPVGFDEDLFSPNSITRDRREGTCRVLFVGSYLPLHGVDVIVRAAKLLASEDIEFILIGGGQTFRSVAQFVKEHKLSRVQLRGNVPMASSHICVRQKFTGRRIFNHSVLKQNYSPGPGGMLLWNPFGSAISSESTHQQNGLRFQELTLRPLVRR